MSFRAVVGSSDKPLSVSDRRVIGVLLGDDDISTITAAAVAQRANTHESTVVRLAQKLGYRGFPDLRADVARDRSTTPSAPTLMRADSGYELARFATDEARGIERLPQFIGQDQLDAAAETVHRSPTVFLFSSPDERAAMIILARRLRRLGKVVVELGVGAKEIAEHFVGFSAGCTLIAFALREASGRLPSLVGEATRRGGRTILISDVPGYHFRPQPHHLLAAQRGDDEEYNTLLVPIALAYALQLAIFHLDPSRYQAVRDDIHDVARLLGGTDEIPLRS